MKSDRDITDVQNPLGAGKYFDHNSESFKDPIIMDWDQETATRFGGLGQRDSKEEVFAALAESKRKTFETITGFNAFFGRKGGYEHLTKVVDEKLVWNTELVQMIIDEDYTMAITLAGRLRRLAEIIKED